MSDTSTVKFLGMNRLTAGIVLVVIALVVGIGCWFTFHREGDPDTTPTNRELTKLESSLDPRLVFSTEFRNVKPDVKYVEDASCAICHQDLCNTFHNHPMGRSATLADHLAPPEKIGEKAKNPFSTASHDFRVLVEGRTVTHRISANAPESKHLPPYQVPIAVSIGSGTHGRSYLSIDNQTVWQSAISWFTEDDRWNVSPGFQLGDGGRRAIIPECLFCHMNHVEPIANLKNSYRNPFQEQLSIGCERCHGPGELHVAERAIHTGPMGKDTSIVNPKYLDVELQKDICRQCHLIGESRTVHYGRSMDDFRPGLPLSHVMSIFVKHPDLTGDQKSVGQFEHMEQSGCYLRGKGQMTCTSCHDPHVSPSANQKADFYRSRCLSCHSKNGCNQPEAIRLVQSDSCIACHMPRRSSSNIAHAAITDHRIPRKISDTTITPDSTSTKAGIVPIVPYSFGKYAPMPNDAERDLGIALTKKLLSLRADRPTVMSLASTARDRLESAVKRWDHDYQSHLSLASLRATFGDTDGRVLAVRKAVSIAPDSEEALGALAESEIYARHFEEALEVTDRLIRMVPSAIEYRLLRVSAQMGKRDWKAAEQTCRDAQSINPICAESHILRAICLEALGKPEEAKKEADAALALETNPTIQRQYQSWFRPKK